MSDEGPALAREPRRLVSVFDSFPPDAPLSLDDVELAMCLDIERRSLAALDRALAWLAAPALPPRPSPGKPDLTPDQPD